MNYARSYHKGRRYPFHNIGNKLMVMAILKLKSLNSIVVTVAKIHCIPEYLTQNVASRIFYANNIVKVFCIHISQMHLIKLPDKQTRKVCKDRKYV